MSKLPIYTREELLEMLDATCVRVGINLSEYARRSGIEYQHILEWRRPGRKPVKINYEDSIRIINFHTDTFGEAGAKVSVIALEDVMEECREIKDLVRELVSDNLKERLKRLQGRSAKESTKADT